MGTGAGLLLPWSDTRGRSRRPSINCSVGRQVSGTTCSKGRTRTCPRLQRRSSLRCSRRVAVNGEGRSFAGTQGLLKAAGQMADNAFVELVVSSFRSFREVGTFQRALASVPEAGSIRVRHLHQGTLQVSVQCRSAGSLLRSLASAYERSFTVLAREPHRIELALQESDSRVAGLV